MGLSLVEKIIRDHLVYGDPKKSGTEIGIKIDHTLTQDATGTMACLQFEALGIPRVKTEFAINYVDHNTMQMGFENADDHFYLQTVASKYGIYFSKAGNGICHQIHLERFAVPGKTLLGSDSHTPTCGGMGMLAIGAGGLDVAIAMGGGPFYFPAPKIVKIELTGKLKPWSSAKDIILTVLKLLTTKGNVGIIAEYGGDGVKTLSVTERATITNMGAELGVTTSIFPSDERTYEYMKAQGREKNWIPLEADPDAQYERIIKIDLNEIEPMVAKPHSPDNVVKISEVEGIKVDQVAIGSCTNSSLHDMSMVAKILEGKTLHPEVSLVIAPGSKQVFKMLADNGMLAVMISAGARIAESACGFCIGLGHSPRTNAVSLRTNNRNFYGRAGSNFANVYLVSPAVAAIAAITGVITDPRKYGDPPQINLPGNFIIDDSMILPPSNNPDSVTVVRGPNIGQPAKNTPVPDQIHGKIIIKVGDKITTDHICPAGAKLKYRSNIPKYAEFVFEPVDPDFPARAARERDNGNQGFILAGESYGQGSSREHAAICPMYLGIRAVIAKSIERIHSANLINFGIIPLIFEKPEDYDTINQDDELEISGVNNALLNNRPLKIINKTNGSQFQATYNLTERQKNILLAGGLLNYTCRQA